MEILYKTNGAYTSKGDTEWYFGKKFVDELTKAATIIHGVTGESYFKFWKKDTGYMAVEIKED